MLNIELAENTQNVLSAFSMTEARFHEVADRYLGQSPFEIFRDLIRRENAGEITDKEVMAVWFEVGAKIGEGTLAARLQAEHEALIASQKEEPKAIIAH